MQHRHRPHQQKETRGASTETFQRTLDLHLISGFSLTNSSRTNPPTRRQRSEAEEKELPSRRLTNRRLQPPRRQPTRPRKGKLVIGAFECLSRETKKRNQAMAATCRPARTTERRRGVRIGAEGEEEVRSLHYLRLLDGMGSDVNLCPALAFFLLQRPELIWLSSSWE